MKKIRPARDQNTKENCPNNLECQICLEIYDQHYKKPYQLTSCGHSICLVCIEDLLQSNYRDCPFCRQKDSLHSKTLVQSIMKEILRFQKDKFGKELKKPLKKPHRIVKKEKEELNNNNNVPNHNDGNLYQYYLPLGVQMNNVQERQFLQQQQRELDYFRSRKGTRKPPKSQNIYFSLLILFLITILFIYQLDTFTSTVQNQVKRQEKQQNEHQIDNNNVSQKIQLSFIKDNFLALKDPLFWNGCPNLENFKQVDNI